MIELVTTRDIEPYFPALEKIQLRKLIFFKSKTFFDQKSDTLFHPTLSERPPDYWKRVIFTYKSLFFRYLTYLNEKNCHFESFRINNSKMKCFYQVSNNKKAFNRYKTERTYLSTQVFSLQISCAKAEQ